MILFINIILMNVAKHRTKLQPHSRHLKARPSNKICLSIHWRKGLFVFLIGWSCKIQKYCNVIHNAALHSPSVVNAYTYLVLAFVSHTEDTPAHGLAPWSGHCSKPQWSPGSHKLPWGLRQLSLYYQCQAAQMGGHSQQLLPLRAWSWC